MNRFKLLYFVIFIINLCRLNAQISDKRLCVDEECKVPISLAKTLLRYSSPDSRILSFGPNVDITIYSKSAGSREDLWGGEINGKRGYIPKHMVREVKLLQKPTILVDTEFTNDTDTKVPSQVEPDKVQEPYEVVDGTTIYLNPQEINPTSTESPVQSTALPPETNKVEAAEEQTQENKNDQNKDTNKEEEEEDLSVAEDTEINIDEEEEEDEVDEDEEEEDVDEEGEEEEDVASVEAENAEDSSNNVEDLNVSKETQEASDSTDAEAKPVETNPEAEIKDDNSEQSEEIKSEASNKEGESEEVVTNEEVPTSVNSSEVQDEPSDNKEAEPSDEQPDEGVSEATVAPVEVTTFSPEVEMPQPFVDQFIEVTPNPLEATEEPAVVTEAVPTLPPLGLFASSSINPDGSQENTHSEESVVEEQPPEDNSTEVELDDVSQSDQSSESAEAPIIEDTTSKESDLSSSEIGNEADEVATNSGFFASVSSLFGTSEDTPKQEPEETLTSDFMAPPESHIPGDDLLSSDSRESFCDATSCLHSEESEVAAMDFFSFNSDVFLYLVTTAISVIIFLFGYIAFDKNKREGPLIAKINNLEKHMLVVLKENEILQEKVASESGYETNDRVSNEVVENLKQDLFEVTSLKTALEEQVQSLEKELENSTEVGMELNRMLSEILSSESGSDVLKANVEHLQRQLVEQQSTVNSVNETLAVTNTENHELRLELELSNKKVLDLQAELDKLVLNILKIEEEKDSQQSLLENEIANLRQKYEETNAKLRFKDEDHNSELKQLNTKLEQSERKLELKIKEQAQLTDTLKQLKTIKKDEKTLQSLLEVGAIKAELQLLKGENERFAEKIHQDEAAKVNYDKREKATVEEIRLLKEKYDEADKLRVETQTKLEVLSNYFKDREAQWQKEISKHEALWAEKEGEATSTTERIKFMQEQLQNYKAQTESLKQEIMSQEIELKSQISVLEKKAHENWVSARQAERKLEEAKQEAAQLRHRLTLRERAIQEDKNQHRLQSPIEQNGDMPVSPMESPASPPLLYGTRDHITKSPPLPGLPPFLPPPPGVPFMPPPMHGVPPFIPPPPPNMFPGDHRPPPLGRMSSPPLNSRYSPSSRGYSPYDRNSSSPSDSEYGTSPPHRRAYSPFNSRSDDRRDYKRPPPGRSNGRNLMKGGGSSGSGHSNESLEKISRQQSKV